MPIGPDLYCDHCRQPMLACDCGGFERAGRPVLSIPKEWLDELPPEARNPAFSSEDED